MATIKIDKNLDLLEYGLEVPSDGAVLLVSAGARTGIFWGWYNAVLYWFTRQGTRTGIPVQNVGVGGPHDSVSEN